MNKEILSAAALRSVEKSTLTNKFFLHPKLPNLINFLIRSNLYCMNRHMNKLAVPNEVSLKNNFILKSKDARARVGLPCCNLKMLIKAC